VNVRVCDDRTPPACTDETFSLTIRVNRTLVPTILNLPSKVTIDDDRQVGKQDGAELIFFIMEIAIVCVIPMRLCFPST